MSARYLEAIRYPHRITTRLEVWRAGVRLDEELTDGEGLPFSGGDVTVDTSPGVRRTLTTELAPAPGLWELLAPVGTELRPVSVLRYPGDVDVEEVPLGRFPILDQLDPVGVGPLKVTASDLYARVQRARFVVPRTSTPGRLVTDTIVDLVRDVLGASWPARVTATSRATVGALVWDRDRAKAIEDLAKSIGADVAIAVDGAIVIRDLPTPATVPVLTVATGAGGVIVGGARKRSRRKTYNVVVAQGKAVDGTALFPPQLAWDNDERSATYAGPDPLNRPDLAGPMGVVPYFLTSELLRTADQALAAARARLWRVIGLEQQVALSASPNVALDGLDVVTVVLVGGDVQRHVLDRIVNPLGVTGAQQIDTRSSRPDDGADETETGAAA